MFTVITAKKKGYLRRSPEISVVKRDDISFCVMQLKNPNRINWQRVERLLGDTKKRVILSKGILPPCEGAVEVADDTAYSHCLTQNALCEILRQHSEFLQTKRAVLIDIFGRYLSYAEILLRYFKTVKVITHRTDIYYDYAEQKRYSEGAVLLISDIPEKQCSAALYVSPDGVILPSMSAEGVSVISARPVAESVKARVYHSFEAAIPSHLAGMLPDGVEPYPFLAALYQYCGIRSLCEGMPIVCKENNEQRTMDEIIINMFSLDTL